MTNMPPFLQTLFDRGIDPLDDPAARAWLDAHPDALESFALLRADLARLRAEVPPAPDAVRRGSFIGRPWLVAAVAAGALLLWALPGPSAPAKSSLPRPDLAPPGYVVHSSVVTSIQDDARTFRDVVEAGFATRQRRVSFRIQRPASEAVPSCTVAVANEVVLNR